MTRINFHFSNIKYLHNQKGVALIVVMLIVALITVLAVEMSSRLQLNVARTTNLKSNNQAYWYALGAEQFAQNSLATLNSLSAENINLSQAWAETFEYPVEGGVIKAQLTDMQACFNLNAVNSVYTEEPDDENQDQNSRSNNRINDPNRNNRNQSENGISNSQKAFQNLLETFIQDSLVIDTLRDSLIDWIDEDSTPKNYGAEDPEYESQPFPYLAANNPMSHPSEIRLLNGMDQLIQQGGLKQILNVVCVLPETSLSVNVNTITEDNAVVLSALLGDTLDVGQTIIANRPEEGFASKEDFLALPEVKSLDLIPEKQKWFDVKSKYFGLKTTATFQDSRFTLSTVFRLDDGGIAIVSREFGGAF